MEIYLNDYEDRARILQMHHFSIKPWYFSRKIYCGSSGYLGHHLFENLYEVTGLYLKDHFLHPGVNALKFHLDEKTAVLFSGKLIDCISLLENKFTRRLLLLEIKKLTKAHCDIEDQRICVHCRKKAFYDQIQQLKDFARLLLEIPPQTFIENQLAIYIRG